MAEPENHTLHLLREMRDEARESSRRTDTHFATVASEIREVRGEIAALRSKMDDVIRAFAGEYLKDLAYAATVDERFTALETRVSALEEHP